jgi:hypothetical protein
MGINKKLILNVDCNTSWKTYPVKRLANVITDELKIQKYLSCENSNKMTHAGSSGRLFF